MSWDIGDPVPLSITIKNAAGTPENAGNVDITITAPDGTVTSQSGVVGTSGVYSYTYLTTQAGTHRVRWVATGLNAGSFNDILDVRPNDFGDFISLTDAKGHMQITNTASDDKIKGFVSAACQMIADRMGQVSPITVVADLEPIGNTIVLETYPVIAVVSLEYLPGLEVITPADDALSITGWKLTAPNRGIIKNTAGSFSNKRVRITYRAGRAPIPANFRMAALELTSHLWRMSQLNPGGGRPPVANDDSVIPGSTYSLPYTVRQLLGLDKRARSGVFI